MIQIIKVDIPKGELSIIPLLPTFSIVKIICEDNEYARILQLGWLNFRITLKFKTYEK